MLRRSFQLLGVVAALALMAAPVFAVQYTITDLGDLGYPDDGMTCAYGINENGQVVGTSYHYEPNSGFDAVICNRAFIWENGTMTDLGPFPLGNKYDYVAKSINNSGVVVGNGEPVSNSTTQAYLWSGGTSTAMVANKSWGNAINNNGLVAVSSMTGYFPEACLYDTGTSSLTNLATLGGFTIWSESLGINAGGDVVGFYDSGSYINKAFFYDYSAGTITEIYTATSGGSRANDINNSGLIVGIYSDYDGFLYDLNTDTTVFLDEVDPADINNNGQVVGQYDDTSACLYENGTTVMLWDQLDTAGQTAWTSLREAYAINDSGWIVGAGLVPGSTQLHAYVMKPVPEPSTIALTVMGLVGLLCYAWRKRK